MVDGGGSRARTARRALCASLAVVALVSLLPTWGCAGREESTREPGDVATLAEFDVECQEPEAMKDDATMFDESTPVSEVMTDRAFRGWGRLIFPADEGYMRGSTLGDLSFTWYSCVDPAKTVEVCNYLNERAQMGNVVFLDLYTEEEKAADPRKRDTGLVFFKGGEDSPFAIVSAGGGFAYVAAMHDSFPQALELSKRGYNAFALIYRPGAQTACEDLARATEVVFGNADELGVSTEGYSYWGGSAGGRMSAWVSSMGSSAFGARPLPKPAAAVIQYTGLSECSASDVPTYSNVGDSDGIADWRVMERRLQAMTELGIPTEFHVYEGLGHGFGLGAGTEAEGWIDEAISFWEKQR